LAYAFVVLSVGFLHIPKTSAPIIAKYKVLFMGLEVIRQVPEAQPIK
jgi:hypothetical protein